MFRCLTAVRLIDSARPKNKAFRLWIYRRDWPAKRGLIRRITEMLFAHNRAPTTANTPNVNTQVEITLN